MTSVTPTATNSSSESTNMAALQIKPRQLRIATYLCPSLPVELFQLIAEFLEEDLGCETTLLYEWRAAGPLPNRADPFADNTIDLAFVSVPSYQRLVAEGSKSAELLPAAAVFKHARNTEHVRGYYSDVVIHADRTKHIKEFLDLRGCALAYSAEDSLSGSTVILQKLRQAGEKASFFGNKLKAGSHLHALQMVRSKQADAAAVDSNALAQLQRQLVAGEENDLAVLTSIGPLPPYPLLVNTNLPAEVRQQLASSLLAMSARAGWGERLLGFGVERFVASGPDAYRSYHEIQTAVKGMSLGIRYY